jgi:hypothetical protein
MGTHLTRTRIALAMTVSLLLTAGALLIPSPGSEAYPQDVTGGHLDWGVKESFRTYVTGPIAQGQIILNGGATQNADGTFRFPARATGNYDNATVLLSSGYNGSVRFVGHAGALDMTIYDIKVNKTSSTVGVIIADVISRSLEDGQFYTYNDINFGDLNFTGKTPTVTETSVAWSNVPAKLTQQGVPGFANFYQAGDDLDPVSPSLTIRDNCPGVANPGQENQDGDAYGDACEQPHCINVVNWWTVPNGDSDCDGYPDSVMAFPRAAEATIGTDPNDKCMNTSATNDEPLPDAWPVDFNDNQLANVADVLSFNFVFGQPTTNPPVNFAGTLTPVKRWDLNNSGLVNLSDVLQFNPFFGLRCSP